MVDRDTETRHVNAPPPPPIKVMIEGLHRQYGVRNSSEHLAIMLGISVLFAVAYEEMNFVFRSA
jgi:hypothetical protein